MKLFFLGTGPAVAIPRKGHRDTICRSARRDKKSARTRSSALLKTGETNILIDCSPDFLSQAKRAHVKKIDAILLTHAHADAAHGLAHLADWLKAQRAKIPLYAEAAAIKKIPRREKFLPRAITPYKTFKIADLFVTPLRVRHSMTAGFPTVGYFFGKRLAYASDVGALPPKTKKIIKGVRALILDGALFFGRKMPAHLNTAQAINLAAELKVKNLILTQIGHSYPPHKEAEHAIANFLKKQKNELPVRLAYDGLTVNVLNS